MDKNTPSSGEFTTLKPICQKFLYISATFDLFYILYNENKDTITLTSIVFYRLSGTNIFKLKFCYFWLKRISAPLPRCRLFKDSFSAIFEQNSGVHSYLHWLMIITDSCVILNLKKMLVTQNLILKNCSL
jgi:hypothetical protein